MSERGGTEVGLKRLTARAATVYASSGASLPVDLRQRAVSAVAAGATCRQVSERFGVSRASVSRWSQQKQREGHVAPKPLGGDRRSGRLKAHADLILQIYRARPPIFLRELRAVLQEHGVEVSTS